MKKTLQEVELETKIAVYKRVIQDLTEDTEDGRSWIVKPALYVRFCVNHYLNILPELRGELNKIRNERYSKQ